MLRGVQRSASHFDTHHSVNPLIDPQSQINAGGVRQGVRSRSSPVVVFKNPLSRLKLPVSVNTPLPKKGLPGDSIRPKKSGTQDLALPAVKNHHVSVQKLSHLLCGSLCDLRPVVRF